MDAEEIDDLITNYSEFEKKIDDKIQAYQKLKDSPDSIATAILIQSLESQKKSSELAERMFHISRVMVILAGGALIIATGALTFASLVYFTPGPDKTIWGIVTISIVSIVVIAILIIFWPRKEKTIPRRKK
jgi:subtilase family serine protease